MHDIKRHLGPVICFLGLLMALTASAKPPDQGGRWPDTVPHAAGGLVLALAGTLLWRQQTGRGPSPSDEKAGRRRAPPPVEAHHEALWADFMTTLETLEQKIAPMPLEEAAAHLHHLHDRFVLPLSHARKTFLMPPGEAHGLAQLTLFSRGELWINRAQSTAGDQHREETMAAIRWAKACFLEVDLVRKQRMGTPAIMVQQNRREKREGEGERLPPD